MALFYSAFVPCLDQRSLEQGVEFWDTMTNVIVYVIFFLSHCVWMLGFCCLLVLFLFCSCLQCLFQEDFNSSSEADFESVTKSK